MEESYDLYENYHGSETLVLSDISYDKAKMFAISRPGDFFLKKDGVYYGWKR